VEVGKRLFIKMTGTSVVADGIQPLKNGRAMESEERVRRAEENIAAGCMRNVPLRDESGKLVSWLWKRYRH